MACNLPRDSSAYKLSSFREAVFFGESAIYLRFRIWIAGCNFGFADLVLRPVNGALLYRLTLFQSEKLARWLDCGAGGQH